MLELGRELMALIPILHQWWQNLYETTLLNPFIPFLLILCLVLSLKLSRSGETKLNLPPSPPKLPIIGHLQQLGILPHRSLQALSFKYGPLVLLQLGCVPTLVVTSAEIAKEIMKNQDAIFSNRAVTWAADILFYGSTDVGFSPYGNYWKQARKICLLEFWSPKRVQSFRFVREEEVTALVEKIRHVSSNGASINLTETMVDVTCNIISRCVLGRKFEEGGGEDGKKSFGELSKKAMELFGAFCFRDIFPFLGWMGVVSGLARRLKEAAEGLDAFLDQMIDEHRNSKMNDGQPDGHKECFIGSLLRLQKDGELDISLTQDNIKALLQDMFVGGTNTTATVMEWAMAELMKHPIMMKKAQEEVRRVVGQKAKIDEDDINQMGYLKCVIKEALRLHAPAPFLNPRESTASTKLEGYDIPPKTRVFINVWAIQRDPKLWDRPEEFVPERFEGNPVDFRGQDFQFIPFGAGRRGCPGFLFGMVEAECVLANLLYWFHWELPGAISCGENLDMSEVYGLVVHKKIPLQLVPLLYSP